MRCNSVPDDGWLFSRGRAHALGPHGDHVGIGGTATEPGKLIFLHGDDTGGATPIAGRTAIERWTWNHLIFIRDGDAVRLYLNDNPQPEIELESAPDFPPSFDQFFFGGRSDNAFNWEGRLDEIALFDRLLSPQEIQQLAVP